MPASTPQDRGLTATWALAVAQLVAWGAIYYAFSLFVVPMEHAPGWSRTSTNAALSVGLLVSGPAAYPVGMWIDRGHGRAVMAGGSVLASAMLAVWSQAHSLPTLFVVWAGLGVAMAATLYDPVFAVITRSYPGRFRTKITLSPSPTDSPVRHSFRSHSDAGCHRIVVQALFKESHAGGRPKADANRP